MNTKSLLDQLLRSGAEMLQGKSSSQGGYSTSQHSQHHSQHYSQQAAAKTGSDLTSQLSSLLSGKGGAALADEVADERHEAHGRLPVVGQRGGRIEMVEIVDDAVEHCLLIVLSRA